VCSCSVITDVQEWQFFKKLNNLQTPLEKSMFLDASPRELESGQSGKVWNVFLKPSETVHVPFKYQSLTILRPANRGGQDEPTDTPPSDLFEATSVRVGCDYL
jgi:hypothetical protein